jgi:hypothetical protein
VLYEEARPPSCTTRMNSTSTASCTVSYIVAEPSSTFPGQPQWCSTRTQTFVRCIWPGFSRDSIGQESSSCHDSCHFHAPYSSDSLSDHFCFILTICQLLPRSIWRFPWPCCWAWMGLAPRAPGPCCASFRQTCAPCRRTLRPLGCWKVNSSYYHNPPPSCMVPLPVKAVTPHPLSEQFPHGTWVRLHHPAGRAKRRPLAASLLTSPVIGMHLC